ncbi:MAG: DUF6148 family protein [Desulfobacterium sp.]
MAGITLSQAEAKLTTWMAAEDAVATSQAYSIGARQLTRANLKEIRETIDYWEQKVNRLSRGGIRITGGTPC